MARKHFFFLANKLCSQKRKKREREKKERKEKGLKAHLGKDRALVLSCLSPTALIHKVNLKTRSDAMLCYDTNSKCCILGSLIT